MNVTQDFIDTLDWMTQDMNYRREQTGLEAAPLSPEMQKAEALLADLRAGRIECLRANQ